MLNDIISIFFHKSIYIYVTVLSLLEMHSGGNVQQPRCCPSSPGILGASDLILIYYWGGLHSAAPMVAVLAPQYSDT